MGALILFFTALTYVERPEMMAYRHGCEFIISHPVQMTEKAESGESTEEGKEEQKEKESKEVEEDDDIETIIQQTEEELETALPYDLVEEEERVEMFSLKGYYRARFFVYSKLPAADNLSVSYVDLNFFQSRLRLDPTVNLSPSARISSQIDILDDVLWGEKTKGFSVGGEFICNQFNDGLNISRCDGLPRIFAVKRIWGEIDSILTVPVKLKIGRQPVHFGIGAHLNDGNWFENIWGDAHIGTTRDRISALTTIIKDKIDLEIGVDILKSRLTRESFAEYFLISRFKTHRVDFALYKSAQRSKQTELYSFLPYVSYSPFYNLSFQLESGIFIGNVGDHPIFDNFSKYRTSAWNIASRIKWETGLIRLTLDLGYSKGDDKPGDVNLRSIPMHPDFNVGFILYEDVLARYTANIAREIEKLTNRSAELFTSRGGVFGSYYLMPTIGVFPFESVGAYVSTLFAFSDQKTLVDPRTNLPFFGREAKKGFLGVELNFGLRIGTENLDFGTQLGYLILGDALRQSIPPGAKNTFKTQFRFTWMF